MCRCRPSSSSRSEASRRSIAAGADCRPKPNFVFGPPVEIDGWVSGLMPGATRSWTRCVGAFGHEAIEMVDVGVVVDDDMPDAGGHRLGQLGLGLRVAVQVDPRGVEAGLERDRQLAARGHVARQALLAQDAQDGGARKGLGGEVDLEVLAAGRVGADEGPRALADVVLDDDVGGRAELVRQGDGVAAAQLEVPGLGDPAAERIDVAEVRRGHGARHDPRSCAPSTSSRPPSWAARDGLAYALFLPEGAGAGRRGDAPRRRLAEGEPVRRGARPARRGRGGGLLRPARPRRERRRARRRRAR